jgi:hypothetical protein
VHHQLNGEHRGDRAGGEKVLIRLDVGLTRAVRKSSNACSMVSAVAGAIVCAMDMSGPFSIRQILLSIPEVWTNSGLYPTPIVRR